MRKGLLLLFAGLMVFFGVTAQSMASSRMDSMGADYRQFDDQDQIWLYPNKALLYKDTIDFRLYGQTDAYYQAPGVAETDYNEWGGVLKDAGDIGVIGAYFNRPSQLAYYYGYSYNDWWGGSDYTVRSWQDSPMYAQPFTPVGGWWDWSTNVYANLSATTPENKVDLFWANSYADMNLGVVVNYGDAQQYDTNFSEYSQTLGINIAAGFTGVGPFNALNVHVGYQMGSYSYGATEKDNGIYTIPFGAMGDINLDANNTLRVYLDGQLNQFALQTVGAGSYTEKQTSSHILLGSAINKKISGGKGLASLGLTFGWGDYGDSSTQVAGSPVRTANYWDLIANLSVETPVSNWLTWRAGLTRMFFERWYNSNGSGTNYYGDDWLSDYSSQSGYSVFTTGFAVNVENWTLDAYISAANLEALIGDPSFSFLFDGYYNAGGYANQPFLEVLGLDAKVKI